MPQSEQDEKPWMIASLARGLQLLELIAQRQCGCSAKWLSHVSGIKLSTCYHLLNTLVYAGYLEKDRQLQEYMLTDKVAHLNNLYQSQRHIPPSIKVLAQALVHSSGETVYVATWERDEVILNYIAEGTQHVKVRSLYVGYKEHAFVRALGKAVLANVSQETLTRYYQSHLPTQCTPRSHVRWEHILADLRRVRDRGYALDEQEFEAGVCCIGAPIYRFDRSIWGAMSVSMPASRFDAGNEALIAFVQGQALTASLSLGYPGNATSDKQEKNT
jgi:DNA-binding IclR family transcriptional regulator